MATLQVRDLGQIGEIAQEINRSREQLLRVAPAVPVALQFPRQCSGWWEAADERVQAPYAEVAGAVTDTGEVEAVLRLEVRLDRVPVLAEERGEAKDSGRSPIP